MGEVKVGEDSMDGVSVEDDDGTSRITRVAVLGNGGWGTALALVALRGGAQVRMWGIDAAYVRETERLRENPRYLPGVHLPDELGLTGDAAEACAEAELLVSAIPTQFVRKTLGSLAEDVPAGIPALSASKGLEMGTLARPTQIIVQTLGERPVGVLSGPSHAEETARGQPTSVVVASADPDLRNAAQRLFSDHAFRAYRSDDVVGVELAAALKNVIALAAGVVDGLGLGDNAKAALITRGAAEIARLGSALGAQSETFSGLAGIGDLITTCVSPHGRNRAVGERLGRGEQLDDVLASMQQVAEGVPTTRGALELARRHGVELPICEQMGRLLFEGAHPQEAVRELMTRALRFERER